MFVCATLGAGSQRRCEPRDIPCRLRASPARVIGEGNLLVAREQFFIDPFNSLPCGR